MFRRTRQNHQIRRRTDLTTTLTSRLRQTVSILHNFQIRNSMNHTNLSRITSSTVRQTSRRIHISQHNRTMLTRYHTSRQTSNRIKRMIIIRSIRIRRINTDNRSIIRFFTRTNRINKRGQEDGCRKLRSTPFLDGVAVTHVMCLVL